MCSHRSSTHRVKRDGVSGPEREADPDDDREHHTRRDGALDGVEWMHVLAPLVVGVVDRGAAIPIFRGANRPKLYGMSRRPS